MPAYDRDDALPIGLLGDTPLAVVTNAHKFFEIPIEDIAIPEGMRALDEAAVEQIVQSIKVMGSKTTQGVICAQWSSPGEQPRATLVAGRHRLEALRRLGWPKVPVAIFEGDAAAARLGDWLRTWPVVISVRSNAPSSSPSTWLYKKLSKMDRFWADGGIQAALAPLLASSAHRGRKSIAPRKSLGCRLRPDHRNSSRFGKQRIRSH